jgi:glycosyltransferase involved in cell wall biosynthesis
MSRIALLFDPWMLSFRGSLDLDGYRDDPRGMSGSEMCAVRLYEEWRAAGHEVMLFTKGQHVTAWEHRSDWEFDVAVSVNCPDPLRDVRAKVNVCYALLNDWTFARAGFWEHVDLFASPSRAHLDQCLHNPDWRKVEVSPTHPDGKVQWDPSSKQWAVVPLGCDPERYDGVQKVPGRVVHCSSPDRGLHLLLQEWPAVKRAVPHATLRIFYRLRPWIDSMLAQCDPRNGGVYPSVLSQVNRAIYIDEALRRMADPKWGITVCDSVSRAQIEREMAEAECLAFPCDPVNSFTEGFSCSTLEGCAARACPVIFDSDALGSIYRDACVVVPRGDIEAFRSGVIEALTNEGHRAEVNARARACAEEHTWRATAEKLMAAIKERLDGKQ